jgi:sec-independent protein translocase protein TatC
MDDTPQPLLSHMAELRTRVVYCVVCYVAALAVCYYYAQGLFNLLTEPLAHVLGPGRRLIYTGLTEAFTTYVKVAAFAALVVTSPLLAWHGWRFVGPGLYRQERTAFALALIATPLLFIGGALFAYFVVCPLAYHFFVSFETTAAATALPIQLEARIGEYLGFVIRLMVAFGLCFELPLILTLLVRLGIVARATLVRQWRIFILGIFGVSALITPPDLVSMLALALPLSALYGLSLWLTQYRLLTK